MGDHIKFKIAKWEDEKLSQDRPVAARLKEIWTRWARGLKWDGPREDAMYEAYMMGREDGPPA